MPGKRGTTSNRKHRCTNQVRNAESPIWPDVPESGFHVWQGFSLYQMYHTGKALNRASI